MWYNVLVNIKINTTKLNAICEANDISYLGLFGSCATGTQRPGSDVDLLVDFDKSKSLLEKGRAIADFQDLFKRDIDLVNKKNLRPELKPYVNQQVVTLYVKK